MTNPKARALIKKCKESCDIRGLWAKLENMFDNSMAAHLFKILTFS